LVLDHHRSVKSSAKVSSSGDRPARTISTIRRLNSGAYPRRVFAIAAISFDSIGVSTKPGQLQLDEMKADNVIALHG
jgi:hypothetical protein